MKKNVFRLLLIFTLLFGISNNVNAQTYFYKGFQAAYKYVENRQWTNWTDWKKVSVLISIDYDNDIIKVHSNTPQIYVVTNYDKTFTDSSGGQQVQFTVIDQDYDVGKIRLRIERNGNSQVYVEFADVILVWNVVRISN